MEIAIAEFPVGELIAGHGLHFHIGGQEVVTTMGAVLDSLVYKKLRVEALAYQAAVVVGKGHDDSLDRFAGYLVFQLFKGQ